MGRVCHLASAGAGPGRGGDGRGELAGGFQRREVTGAVEPGEPRVGEELADTVVGTAIRPAGAGTCSASEAATDPAPAWYQAIEAANAPGGP